VTSAPCTPAQQAIADTLRETALALVAVSPCGATDAQCDQARRELVRISARLRDLRVSLGLPASPVATPPAPTVAPAREPVATVAAPAPAPAAAPSPAKPVKASKPKAQKPAPASKPASEQPAWLVLWRKQRDEARAAGRPVPPPPPAAVTPPSAMPVAPELADLAVALVPVSDPLDSVVAA
jgi:hypothetical protein